MFTLAEYCASSLNELNSYIVLHKIKPSDIVEISRIYEYQTKKFYMLYWEKKD